jgi:hypothetical protein
MVQGEYRTSPMLVVEALEEFIQQQYVRKDAFIRAWKDTVND